MNEAKPDINKVLFMHLVSMLAMSAIQQMGKLVDPNTGKSEINLEAAQATIDMLDMLEARTRGNLDAEETRLLKDTLMSLKMNYVESKDRKSEVRGQRSEVSSQKSGGNGTEKQTPNIEHPTSNADLSTEARRAKAEGQEKSDPKSASAEEDKTPKYHKKYE
ncbi:MAG: DUF1844 domain-containing protein [Verrucomicrobia bacterium]|nr:DUF1844 domain-containing protein [Verrucomicrobiota bacterium]MBU1734714.1 DUF1844 domain-containing protein [Verrucomicrobiota bacterium]MBU1857205.1 DUF1844 domain-containing protein [Verrucomicrobiota bacterium]